MDKCININNGKVKEIAAKLGVIPAIAAIRMETWMDNNGGKIPTAEDLLLGTDVNFSLKAIQLLNTDKAKQVFEKGKKNNWDLNKTLTELAIPKDQKQLILDSGKTEINDITTDLLANYSYTVEINTAKDKDSIAQQDANRRSGLFTEEELDNTERNTKYYSNLTVPGGTNYTEQEIATPGITPNIKGHAQFATDKGIGWFRSDVQAEDTRLLTLDEQEAIDEYLMDDGIFPTKNKRSTDGKPTKTRRVLEVQSDLFQKGRGKEDLVTKTISQSSFTNADTFKSSEEELNTLEKIGFDDLSENGRKRYKELKEILKGNTQKNTSENQFLQLLNKDSNWVTFFVKSIIQDSIKKGYEKVLFPSGNTASKVEGHTTLEEYKKQKEDRIKELENTIKERNITYNSFENKLDSYFNMKMFNSKNKEEQLQLIEDTKVQLKSEIKSFNNEITQLKQELERVEGPEGFGALKPIYNFYENTVTNVINKIYGKENVKQVTDEYGNTWNEIQLNENRDFLSIGFNKTETKKTMPKDVAIKILNQFKNRLDVDYKFVTPEQAKEILKDTKDGWNGETGFYFNGIAYAIDGENIDFDTPIHEMGHPFVRAIMKHNPKLFNNIMTDLIKSDEGAAIFDEVEDAGYTEGIMEEVAVRALTRAAQKNFDAKGSLFGKAVTRLINLLKSTLRNVFGVAPLKVKDINVNTTLEELADIFSLKIGKIEGVGVKDNTAPGYNRSLQQNSVNKLTSFQGKQTQFDTYYTVEGFDTKLARPSTLAKKVIQGREQYKTEEEQKQQEKFMASGTFLHDIMSEIVRREFPEENKHRAPMDITPDMSSYYSTMQEFMAPIIKEAKDNGDVLLTEIFVGNLKTERGGTIDLLAVTPKGNYRIYDLKNRYRPDRTNLTRYNKIGEFSRQLEIYKAILEDGDEKLGIPKGKVESTLVLENKVSYNDAKGVITKINGITVVAPDFLMTTDDKINNLIVKLTAQLQILAEKAKQDTNTLQKETTNKLLKSKMELLQGLQLRQDVNSLIEHAEQELAYIKIYLKDETNLDTTGVISELDLYTELVTFVDTTKLTPEMDKRLGLVQYEAAKIKNAFLERQKEILLATAGEMDTTGNAKLVDNLFAPIKDENAIRKFTTGIGEVDNALVQTAFRVYNNSIEKVAEKMDVLKEKFLGVLSRYEKVIGSKNFDILLNNKKTALVTEFSSEFWDEFKKNRKVFDLKWAKENLDYDVDAYEKALADFETYQDAYKETQMKRLEVIQSNKGFIGDELAKEVYGMYWAIREKDKNQWLEQNKNNPYQYFKAKSKWTDPKWKEIKQGKYKGTAVEEFYDFYTNYMRLANEIAPEKIRPGFIANFSQDFLEKVSNLGMIGAIKGGWSELLNSLELKYDEALFGKVDPNTGEQIRKNFIPGLGDAKQLKSTDLGKSFLMFMEGVFRYDEISKIESTMSNIKYQLRNVSEQRIDSQGNPVVGGVTTVVNPTKGISEKLEYMIDALIYGKKQKDEGSFQITGNGLTSAMGLLGKGETKTIAYAKLVDKMIRYTGLRNLAFNIYAPIVNILGGTANMYITGAGGLDYTAGDLTKAIGLITAGKFKFQSVEGQKMRLILEWLRLDKEKIDRDIFRKVTNNTSSAILDEYNGMTGMRESEAAMVESGAAAMILSGKHSVTFEDFDVVDGKLVLKKEFTSIAKSMFKQKVMAVNSKSIGSMSPDDVMLAKKYMLGRMLMQHRSWLPAQAFARFGSKRFNYVLERYTEGRYRVAVRAFKAIMAKGVSKGMESLTPEEEAAAKEAFAEATIIIGTMLLLAALHAVDDDDKEEAWYKMTNKVSTRVLGELFFFADPTLQSQWTILQSPAASTSTIEDAGKLVRDIFREASADFQEDPDKVRKAAKPGKRAIKMIPYLSKTKSFLDDLYNVDEKDK